jgi:DNA-binding transcriptional LysR family regulator
MEIRHLLYFTEVARRHSFSAAAEALYVTQPTISKMVQNLEDELGVFLFNRAGKKVELTDAGRAILKPAQDIVKAFQNLSTELDEVAHLRTGNIRIGMPPMAGVGYFSQIAGGFSKKYPQISIQWLEFGSKWVEQGLLAGEVDLGIIQLPLHDDRFEIFEFVCEPVVAIVGPGHKFFKQRTVNLQDLSNDKFILFREDFALHDQILEQCRRLGFSPQIAAQSSQWDFIVGMVEENLGIGFLPENVWRRNSRKQVQMLKLEGCPLCWNLAVIWEKNRHLSFAARQWLAFAQTALQGNSPQNSATKEKRNDREANN